MTPNLDLMAADGTSTVEGVVVRHFQYMRTRNLRTQSIYNRKRCLSRLARWLDGPILYATETQLREWQDQRTSEIGAAARAMELSNVREFYRWAVREGFRSDDPTARLDMPRTPRRVPRPISDEILAVALEAADVDMQAILGLAAFAGLRAGEIARLDWSEVEVKGRPPMIRVVDGKGGHGRLIPLAPVLTAILEALPHRRGAVIRRLDGKAGNCQPHRISGRANLWLHAQGATDTLHSLRHRFGTATYRACQDLRAVQELLGHQSPTTTAGYASASPTIAMQAVQQAGMLAS